CGARSGNVSLQEVDHAPVVQIAVNDPHHGGIPWSSEPIDQDPWKPQGNGSAKPDGAAAGGDVRAAGSVGGADGASDAEGAADWTAAAAEGSAGADGAAPVAAGLVAGSPGRWRRDFREGWPWRSTVASVGRAIRSCCHGGAAGADC